MHESQDSSEEDSEIDGLEGLFAAALDPAKSVSASPVLELSGFELVEKIGQGGAGGVWRARQTSTGRDVAVKLLGLGGGGSSASTTLLAALAEEGGENFERFRREVEIIASLDHPNIAKVFESGLDDGLPYFAMELVDGLPLDQHVREQGLDQKGALELFAKVCGAVQHAHQNGVIHRDLKPSNILVNVETGEPKVLDFGLAKAFDQEGTEEHSLQGRLVGTPIYMSPEQADGSGRLDTRSDVYSLGVVLYQLLTGSFPYSAEGSELAIARRVAEEEPARPDGLNGDLSALLFKALSKSPGDRYATAGALGDEVGRFLADKPLEAKAPTASYHLRKHIGRHRAAWAAALVALIAVIGGAVGYLQQARSAAQRERGLREVAETEQAAAEKNAEERAVMAGVMQLQLAQGALDRDKVNEALAHLSQALRADPGNRSAAELAGNLLLLRLWPLASAGASDDELDPEPKPGSPRFWKHSSIMHPGDLSGKNEPKVQPEYRTNRVAILDSGGGTIGAALKHPATVEACAIDRSAGFAATLTKDGEFFLWDVAGKRLLVGPIVVGDGYKKLRFDSRGWRVRLTGDSVDPLTLSLRAPAGVLSFRRDDSPLYSIRFSGDTVERSDLDETKRFDPGEWNCDWDLHGIKLPPVKRRDETLLRIPLEQRDFSQLVALKTMRPEWSDEIYSAVVDPTGQRFAAIEPLRVCHRDPEIDDIVAPVSLMSQLDDPVWLGLSPGGKYLVAASMAGGARLWDIDNNRNAKVPSRDLCCSLAMNRTEPVAYLATSAGQVMAVDLPRARSLWERGGTSAMTSVRHDEVAGAVLSVSIEGDLSVWGDETGEPIGRPLAVGGPALQLPLEPSQMGGKVLVRSLEKGIRIWDWRLRAAVTPWFGNGQSSFDVKADWEMVVMADLTKSFVYRLFVPDADAPEWFVGLLEHVAEGTYFAQLDDLAEAAESNGRYAELLRAFLRVD